MLIQNQYDGRLYEVPDMAGYGEYAGPGYHGLGIPFLAPLAAKIGARILPKALPFARRLLRRFGRRLPRFRRVPFMPGYPFPGRFPGRPHPIPTALLSARVARNVVAMLRQQGLQVTPATAPPGPAEGEAPPPGPEAQPGVGEFPFDPQGADQEFDPYAEQYPEGYPYQDPYQQAYQYPYSPTSPWRRFYRRFRGQRFPGGWRHGSSNWARRSAGFRGRSFGGRARHHPHASVRRAAPHARPVRRGRR